MIKKGLNILLIMLTATLGNTSVFAEYIGGNPGMDFFKKIDTGSVSIQTTLMDNELNGSAKKINDYSISMGFGCGAGRADGCFDESKDFTYGELKALAEDENLVSVVQHLKKEYETTDTNNLQVMYSNIYYWFTAKEQENLAKEASMSRVSIVGLFNDGDVQNSGYDLMDDLDKIHKVIFAQDTTYGGTSNSSSSDFGSVLSGDFNSVSSVVSSSSSSTTGGSSSNGGTSCTTTGDIGGSSSNGGTTGTSSTTGGSSSNGGTTGTSGNSGNTGVNQTVSKSNKCLTGSSVEGIDPGLMVDIGSQLSNGTSSNTSGGGEGNNNSNSGNGSSSNGGFACTNGNSGGGSSNSSLSDALANVENGLENNVSKLNDTFPCSDIICVKIEMIMYKQSLLGGGKSESIEGIVDKHLKIIDTYASKSLVQSAMTKNAFSLSIIKNLDLPSMLHLGIVVTYLPPPILNLTKSSSSSGSSSSSNDTGEFKDKTILERAFSQNKLDYKTQNDLKLNAQLTDIINCDSLTTNECANKLINTQSAFNPKISNTNALYSKLGEKYKGSLNSDISELVGFSNAFKNNIDGILGTIDTIKDKIK